MSLRMRLAHLERSCTHPSYLSIVCVDEAGCVLEDGTAETRPWIGKRQHELPFAVQVIVGVDPLVVVGQAEEGPIA